MGAGVYGLGVSNTFRASYNGYAFDNASVFTEGVEITPVLSRDGRTVVKNQWVVTLDFLVRGPAATQGAVTSIISRLSHAGQSFVFNGRVGNISVNAGGYRDLEWGPVPEVVSVRPFGNQQCRIKWRVRFSIPHCVSAPSSGAIMDLETTVSYDLDKSGYTTRVFTASLRIPMTRRAGGDRTLPDSADAYLEDVIPALIPGFRRVPPSRELSADKASLRVTVRDEELPPHILPEGVIEAEVSHRIANTPDKPTIWSCSVSGSYEIARGSGRTPFDALKAFMAVVEERVKYHTARLKQILPGTRKIAVRPVSFSMEEPNVYGRTTANFTQNYIVYGPLQVDMMASAPLWRVPPGPSWAGWAASVQDSTGPRGNAKLKFLPTDDAYVDLCQPSQLPSTGFAMLTNTPAVAKQAADLFSKPTPDDSWLFYQNRLEWDCDQGVGVLRTLPKPSSPVVTGPSGGFGGGGTLSNKPGGVLMNPPAALGSFGVVAQVVGAALGLKPPPLPGGIGDSMANVFGAVATAADGLTTSRDGAVKAQGRARPLVYIYMIGHAVRVGFPIPEPMLQSVNGVKVTPANRADRGEKFSLSQEGSLGWPVYVAAWRLRYLAAEQITGPLPALLSPFNPSPDA